MGFLEIDSRRFRAAGAALEDVGPAFDAQLRETVPSIEPEWKRLLSARASTRLERRVIAATGQVTSIDGGVRLEAGKTGGTLRGGLSIRAAAGAVEHGANRAKRKTYNRRGRRRGTHTVTRRTAAQFRPYNAEGYVAGPAVRAIIPKLSQAWTDGFADVVSDALNGKR